jgi:amino acid transporter
MHGFGALMITLSALSPTIGVFVLGASMIHQGGNAAFACFVVAALVGVAMANVYGELAAAFPETGGEYTILGRVLGPAAGFAALGTNLFGLSIASALTGLGATEYLSVLWPNLPAVPTAVVLVAMVTGVGMLNIRVNALITGSFLAVELAALVVVAWLGFTHAHRGVVEAVWPLTMANGHGGLKPVSGAILGVVATAGIYGLNGYGSVVFLGEELYEAPRKIARVVFWALGIGVLTVLAPVLAVLMGARDLAALSASSTPISDFAAAAGGPVVAKVVSLAAALAIFNTMIVVALMAGRQLYATGRDRVWPGPVSRAFALIHPRLHSPWLATLLMGLTSVAWCFAPLELLETLIASGVVVIYGGLCLAVIKGRHTGASAHAPYRMPLYPLFPALALIVLAGMVWMGLMDPKTGRPGLLAAGGIVAISALYYFVALRGRGRWAHRGPQSEGDESSPPG